MSEPSAREASDPTDRIARVVHRELIRLVVLVAIVAAVFVATRALAGHVRDQRLDDARAWRSRGETGLLDPNPQAAIADLRRATFLDPADPEAQRLLAGGLVRAGAPDEARALLLDVRSRHPEDARATLQLARLDAAEGRADDAIRLYHDALNSLWSSPTAGPRRAARLEFIRYLLTQSRTGRAVAELLALDADLPGDPDTQVAVGRLFLEADDPTRAAVRFGRVLREHPDDLDARLGAGQAAFALGDYTAALRYLSGPVARSGEGARLRQVAELVTARDPLAPRLGASERARRVALSATELSAVLDACLATPASVDAPSQQALRDLAGALAPLAAGRVPGNAGARGRPAAVSSRDDVEDALVVLRDAAAAVASAPCAMPAPLTEAIALIARRHALER